MIFYHKRTLCFNKFNALEVYALGGETVAMEELQPWLVETIEIGDSIEKKIGKSKCSEKDRYAKKIGRELASERAKLKKLTVKNIIRLNNKLVVEFTDSENHLYVLVKYQHCNAVFFTHYE